MCKISNTLLIFILITCDMALPAFDDIKKNLRCSGYHCLITLLLFN